MKKLGPISYRNLFFKHVWRFLGNVASKQELEGNHVISVSGGCDSMTLLWFAHQLHEEGMIGKVRAVFVHHHTRSGQDDEKELVEKFCHKLKIPLSILHIEDLKKGQANFEADARRFRRALCFENLDRGELLWQGHHLDDSYEWSFMQRHRSTNPRGALGIPVRNGPVLRPFLCVTKKQLSRIARYESIPSLEDPTNLDLHHERNYVRNVIVPSIRKRYPKYLKHYSHFANFSAMVLKTSILSRSTRSTIFVFDDGAAIVGKEFSPLQIQELIHNYSNSDRGEIMTTLEKMLQAIEKGKKGPFQFSGGVEAYYTTGLLMLYPQKMKNDDAMVAEALRSLSKEALSSMPAWNFDELSRAWQNLLRSPDALMNLPGIVLVLERESVCKTLNTSVFDPLFPEVSQLCRERGFRFTTFQKCLEVWERKKEKLPESLRLVPLSNLSNLFTSQR